MTEAIDIEMSENGFDSERKVLDAPGTALMKISAEEGPGDSITILEPKPTLNPNDPLNWSSGRKAVNFAIVSVFTLLVFALYI
ncbi:uncharacterized protein N7529_001609 [Penicillium soppii]|uniref:uncharacterized protein n=1 Tax=Penicillium soppii TaxID=69789 RepID=UPI002546949E|nr:uncharacterized protein N7529_001609 [Penicillium soppii]KAJ5876025.1 hypothetical protein N7529_001609 [Penicillium soppii]